jgi:putative flippase GtrA
MVAIDDGTEKSNNGFSARPEQKKKFFKFQLTALLATAVDFSMTIILKEKADIYYPWAVAGGATCGAVTAFTINRYWVFRALKHHPLIQAVRYIIVAAGSVILNTAGTFALNETLQPGYIYSKAIVAVIVGFTYSWYLSKKFVFYA